jgi:ABC-type nickel/cobalt efflux system permease component RcnA
MQMDIRLPIGLLFSILGLVITVFGFMTNGSKIYENSLNININIYTGIVLVVFGVFMLFMAMRGQAKKTEAAK